MMQQQSWYMYIKRKQVIGTSNMGQKQQNLVSLLLMKVTFIL